MSSNLDANGQLAMGEGGMPTLAVQDAPVDFNRFRETSAPLAGQPGLDKLVSEGVLRKAQPSDLMSWKEAQRRAQGLPALNVVNAQNDATSNSPFGLYIVQGRMAYPSGLYGAHAAAFIVLREVPRPSGNPGHSAVYDWNTLACEGALCRDGQ